jgi:hypothetical protein
LHASVNLPKPVFCHLREVSIHQKDEGSNELEDQGKRQRELDV